MPATFSDHELLRSLARMMATPFSQTLVSFSDWRETIKDALLAALSIQQASHHLPLVPHKPIPQFLHALILYTAPTPVHPTALAASTTTILLSVMPQSGNYWDPTYMPAPVKNTSEDSTNFWDPGHTAVSRRIDRNTHDQPYPYHVRVTVAYPP